jgi:heavy metal sensor kinase
MRESLRIRLVLWYALALSLVVVLYGGAVGLQSWRAALRGIDAELAQQAEALAAALRPVDPAHFDLELGAESLAFFRRERDKAYYVLWNQRGELVDRSDPDIAVERPAGAIVRTAFGGRELVVPGPAGTLVLVGRDLGDLWRAQRALIVNVSLAGTATLAFAVLAGWFVAGRALAPIARIDRAARAMSAGHLGARIPVERTETELEQVASALNDAFDRLRLALEQQRRFTADASHEFRTPIAVLRAEVDWALERPRTPEQYEQSLVVCRRAAVRMQETVERLMTLARAESSARPAQAAVALQPLLADVAAWFEPLAQEHTVSVSVSAEPMEVRGDRAMLREAVSNVVANAILYNRPSGQVTITARAAGARADIEVVDTGVGIPASAIPNVFDRFFRADPSRARNAGGAGLGLAISRAIVTAHGGTIACSSDEGLGSRFVISLPREASASA